jgi:hypothetical protein
MATNTANAKISFLQFCGQPNTATYGKYDFTEIFDGATPLFACEYSAKTDACEMCDPIGGNYDYYCENMMCSCDPNQDYNFIHMIVSIVSNDSDGNKVTTSPRNSVYQINIVNGYFKSVQFDAVRLRSEEVDFNATIFSVFDIMEIESNISELLKTTTFLEYGDSTQVQKSSSYFYTFDGIAKPDAYYNSFSNLYNAYLNYSPVNVEEKKKNPHIGRKLKNK